MRGQPFYYYVLFHLKGVFCSFTKKHTLNFLDAYKFLKVHCLRNEKKTWKQEKCMLVFI